MPDGRHLDMAIEVRGDDSRALFKVQIAFDVEGDEAPPRERPAASRVIAASRSPGPFLFLYASVQQLFDSAQHWNTQPSHRLR
jgi:hypothetical protein